MYNVHTLLIFMHYIYIIIYYIRMYVLLYTYGKFPVLGNFPPNDFSDVCLSLYGTEMYDTILL